MRIPLFVRSTPSVEQSACVRVPTGNWTIEWDAKETSLNLNVGGALHERVQDGYTFTINSPTSVKAFVDTKGTDKNISLYLNDNLTEHA